MPSEQSKIPTWVKDRAKEQEEKPKGNYFKFPEGETEILVDVTKAPIKVNKFNKERYVYNISANGKDYVLEVGIQLDTLLISALMKGMNPMTVIRAGTKINTQYSVKGLN